MRRATSFILLLVFTVAPSAVGNADTPIAETENGVWTLINEQSLGYEAVSPFAEQLTPIKDRIWTPSMQGQRINDCEVGATCVAGPTTNIMGSDVTIVTLKDGSKRAYFVEMINGLKNIFTAPMNSDGVNRGLSTNTGIANTDPKAMAWGVPDSVVMPDGRVRLYWVANPEVFPGNNSCPEVVKSATSSDASGTSFTIDSGYRLQGGYVDTDVIQAIDGKWLMITSSGPDCEPQTLWLFTSSDGLTWTKMGERLGDRSANRLDPSAIILDSKTIRVYYGRSALGKAHTGPHVITSATLTFGPKSIVTTPTPTPSAVPTQVAVTKKVTISCVKGKTVKKISAVNPKCPAGYKKK